MRLLFFITGNRIVSALVLSQIYTVFRRLNMFMLYLSDLLLTTNIFIAVSHDSSVLLRLGPLSLAQQQTDHLFKRTNKENSKEKGCNKY